MNTVVEGHVTLEGDLTCIMLENITKYRERMVFYLNTEGEDEARWLTGAIKKLGLFPEEIFSVHKKKYGMVWAVRISWIKALNAIPFDRGNAESRYRFGYSVSDLERTNCSVFLHHKVAGALGFAGAGN